jgi:aryl-alcohol dehydrogenase-like predicted oxidoreductase
MKQRLLGRTGLRVSELSLGTVSLGVDYGINAPGEFGRPDRSDALRLLSAAAAAGISLYDTAPAYGESQALLGEALGGRHDCVIATKVPDCRDDILLSIEGSLRALRREAIDVVQIHNATAESIKEGGTADALLRAKSSGKVRFIGASVYGEDAALACVESGMFDVLQVAYNLLDQRMAARVFPAATEASVAVLIRSVLLKGALSTKGRFLPDNLSELRAAVERALHATEQEWETLSDAALRYCLSSPAASVLIGARTELELARAMAASEIGPLPERILRQAPQIALNEERLLNPSHWGLP